MEELLKALLKQLGVETVKLEDLTDPEKVKLIKVEDIVSEVNGNMREVLEADDSFTEPLKSAVRGEIFGKRQAMIIRLFSDHLTKEEVDALPERDRFDKSLELLQKKIKSKTASSGDDKDKEIERLNSDLLRSVDELKKVREEEIPQIKTEYEKAQSNRELRVNLRTAFDKITSGKLIGDADLLYPGVISKLESLYDVANESGSIILLEKGKTTKAFKNSKPVLLSDAITEIAEPAFKKQDPIPPRKLTEGTPEGKGFNTRANASFQDRLAQKEAELLKK